MCNTSIQTMNKNTRFTFNKKLSHIFISIPILTKAGRTIPLNLTATNGPCLVLKEFVTNNFNQLRHSKKSAKQLHYLNNKIQEETINREMDKH